MLTVRRAARIGTPPIVFGHLAIGAITLPCAIGAAGLTHAKREGDKATPAAAMAILEGYYRPDRLARPRCHVTLRPARRELGWCDDPGATLYNRPMPLPATDTPKPPSHETLWRTDELYDVVLVLDWNLHPRRVGRGSAIFFHCARPHLAPTLGCVALRPADMRRLLPRLARKAVVRVV